MCPPSASHRFAIASGGPVPDGTSAGRIRRGGGRHRNPLDIVAPAYYENDIKNNAGGAGWITGKHCNAAT